MDQRKTMGETRTRGSASGRIAALAFACAAVAGAGESLAQARSLPGDKSGAQGLSGTVLLFEETAGGSILYHEAQGSLVNNAVSPAARASGPPAAAPKAAAPKAAHAKGQVADSPTNGAPLLRAPQRKATPAEGVAMRP